MKQGLASAAERTGLLRPAVVLNARLKARGIEDTAAPDGLPLPPARLRLLVGTAGDAQAFIARGRLSAGTLVEALARHRLTDEEIGTALDFGCGCGRVVRHLADRSFQLVGCDPSGPAIAWCRDNLPFMEVVTSDWDPPLPFEAERFGLLYGWSVFTHLAEDRQRGWMRELHRVVRPGGHVILTMHGRGAVARQLGEAGVKRFDAGELVVTHKRASGLNRCGAFHPRPWVERQLLEGFELLEHAPGGVGGAPGADLYVLRRV